MTHKIEPLDIEDDGLDNIDASKYAYIRRNYLDYILVSPALFEKVNEVIYKLEEKEE